MSFTGRQEDGNGLLDYRSRYYRPDLRRFISEDAIGIAGGTNLSAEATHGWNGGHDNGDRSETVVGSGDSGDTGRTGDSGDAGNTHGQLRRRG